MYLIHIVVLVLLCVYICIYIYICDPDQQIQFLNRRFYILLKMVLLCDLIDSTTTLFVGFITIIFIAVTFFRNKLFKLFLSLECKYNKL